MKTTIEKLKSAIASLTYIIQTSDLNSHKKLEMEFVLLEFENVLKDMEKTSLYDAIYKSNSYQSPIQTHFNK
jgi:hypothetical protein